MKINKLTQKLLAEGYTKENPPAWVKGVWNDFYGGWEYPVKMIWSMVFETPCGLLVRGSHFTGGHLSTMGVDWTVENDNPTITCPKYFDGTPCELNHSLLREHSISCWHEKITHCACSLTDKPYEYERSYDKAHDDVWAESEEMFKIFNLQHKGRACEHHSHYSRATKTWSMCYDPMICAKNNIPCDFCKVLQKELSREKGNVYFDVKVTRTVKGIGLFPNEVKTTVTKGKKLLARQTSITICEAIVKYAKHKICQRYGELKIREEIEDPSMRKEIINIRFEKRNKRDLLQDLEDIRSGIEVIHESDQIKEKAQAKRDRKTARLEAKKKQSEKKIIAKCAEWLRDENQSDALKVFAEKELCKRNIDVTKVLQEVKQISLFD